MATYFIGILTPEQIVKKVLALRSQLTPQVHYAVGPHVTIFPSFSYEKSEEEKLVKSLKSSCSNKNAQEITFSGVGFFYGSSKVAYFKPDEDSLAFLTDLFQTASSVLPRKVEKYTPHLTIAKKLSPEGLETAKQVLKSTDANFSFEVSQIYLFQHFPQEKVWKDVAKIPLG